MAKAVASRLLHEPTVRMKRAAGNDDAYLYVSALRELFGLDAETEPENRGPRRRHRAPTPQVRLGARACAFRLATRGSALALAQAEWVAGLLGGAELVEVSSDGEPGDKARLRARGRVGAAGRRGRDRRPLGQGPAGRDAGGPGDRRGTGSARTPADVWIGSGSSLDAVPEGARVGTASLRRRAQLLAARPDLEVGELHGNVDTRLRRLAEGELDAIVLAAAGLRRLGRDGEASSRSRPR